MSDFSWPVNGVLPEGTCLSNYKILKLLGRGGFGITYVAYDKQLERTVVIKEHFPVGICRRNQETGKIEELYEEFAQIYRESKADLIKEARIIASLSHSNIITIHEVFEAQGSVYYVMPYLKNGSLRSRMINALYTLKTENVVELLRGLLCGLSYLHGQNLCHRDIKPDNILFNGEGYPVFIDFGAAKSDISSLTTRGCFSYGYAAPEQITGKGDIGPWSDLYSLAVTFREVITGMQMERADARLMHDDLTPLTRSIYGTYYSSAFLESLDKALRLDVRQRFQSASEWFDYLAKGQTAVLSPKSSKNKSYSVPLQESDDRQKELPCSASQTKPSYSFFHLLGRGLAYIFFWILLGEPDPLVAKEAPVFDRFRKSLKRILMVIFTSISVFCVLIAWIFAVDFYNDRELKRKGAELSREFVLRKERAVAEQSDPKRIQTIIDLEKAWKRQEERLHRLLDTDGFIKREFIELEKGLQMWNEHYQRGEAEMRERAKWHATIASADLIDKALYELDLYEKNWQKISDSIQEVPQYEFRRIRLKWKQLFSPSHVAHVGNLSSSLYGAELVQFEKKGTRILEEVILDYVKRQNQAFSKSATMHDNKEKLAVQLKSQQKLIEKVLEGKQKGSFVSSSSRDNQRE